MTSTEYIEYFEEDEIKREQSESKKNAKDCVREKEKKINCNQCEKQYAEKSDMKRHILAVHEDIKYPCDHCKYQASRQGDLKRHIQSVHNGIKYPCGQCELLASSKGHLTRHEKHQHSVTNSFRSKLKCPLCKDGKVYFDQKTNYFE